MNKMNVYHLRTVETDKIVDGQRIKVGGRPYATVAIEINDDKTVNRGIAICSARDAFVKKIGVKKAIGRLTSAKEKSANVCPIYSFDSTQKRILKKIGGTAKFANTSSFTHLGAYHVAPTEDELKLFQSDFGA